MHKIGFFAEKSPVFSLPFVTMFMSLILNDFFDAFFLGNVRKILVGKVFRNNLQLMSTKLSTAFVGKPKSPDRIAAYERFSRNHWRKAR
jgi:hypothetical protein